MQDPNEVRRELESGKVRECFEYIMNEWPAEAGLRVVAEIGNEGQKWEYITQRGNRDIVVRRVGWRLILGDSGLGKWREEGGEMEAYIVMVDGGRNAVNALEGVKFIVGIYCGEKSITGEKPLVVADEIEEKVVNNFPQKRMISSAFDKLEKVLKGMKVEEKTVTEISVRAA